jgi:transcription initiation factor TFIID subunit 6
VLAVGTKDLFFIDDREIDFTEIIASPLPEAPRESSLSAHWLAVEGVQPAIPQNPTLQIETGDAGTELEANSCLLG